MADLNQLDAAQTIKIAGSDSVGTETNFVNATTNGDLKVSDGLKQGGVQGNLNLITAGVAYQAKVGASPIANLKCLTITALDDMFWGYTNTVTTSTGTPIFKNQTITFDVDPNSSFTIYLVASANNKNARITESP